MPKEEEPTKKMGRPVLPPEEKGVTSSIRLTPGRWEKLRLLGRDWLNKAIDRAKLPKE